MRFFIPEYAYPKFGSILRQLGVYLVRTAVDQVQQSSGGRGWGGAGLSSEHEKSHTKGFLKTIISLATRVIEEICCEIEVSEYTKRRCKSTSNEKSCLENIHSRYIEMH